MEEPSFHFEWGYKRGVKALDFIEQVWNRSQEGEFGEDRIHSVCLAKTYGELSPCEGQTDTDIIKAGRVIFKRDDGEVFYEFEYSNEEEELVLFNIKSDQFPVEFARDFFQKADFEALKAKHRQNEYLADNKLYAEDILRRKKA